MNSDSSQPSGYVFGPFRYDPGRASLRRGGDEIALPSRTLDLLDYFVRRPDVVIGKDELLDAVWPDAHVSEESLTQAVSVLRQALGDDAQSPLFIQTVPRRGYRFIADVVEVGPEERAPRRRHLVFGAAIAAVVLAVVLASWQAGVLSPERGGIGAPTPIESLAVLPFRNLSADPEREYFADGITEALIAELGRLDGLRKVISRTSVMPYKNSTRDLPAIAAELGVEGIVEASVLRENGRVRITAQLFHAPTETPVWSNSYDDDDSDILALIGEVTRSIATEIRIELTPEAASTLATPARVDPAAYDAYLRGLFHLSKFTRADTFEARDRLREAIERQPDYAPAHLMLGRAHFNLGQALGGIPYEEAMPLAKESALRALGLDADLADAHVIVADVHRVYDWDWQGAERGYRRAIALNANAPMAHVGLAFFLSGARERHEEALAAARRARELAPLDRLVGTLLAEIAYAARRFDVAVDECRRVLEIDPDFRRAYLILRWVHEAEGDYERALAASEALLRLDGAPGKAGSLAAAYADRGADGYWGWRLDELLDQPGFVPPPTLAESYLNVGRTDDALAWLETAFAQRSGVIAHLQYPRWDALRSHERFLDLRRRAGLPPRGSS